MSRKTRYQDIKQLRKYRDEIHSTDNYGRALHLLLLAFNIIDYYTQDSSDSVLEVELVGGWRFLSRDDSLLKCVKQMCTKLYFMVIKNG